MMLTEHSGPIDLSSLEVKKKRRDGSSVIYSDNQSRIVRYGRIADLHAERANHDHFLTRGFSVPRLLTPVILIDNATGYYVESWLGPKSLGQQAGLGQQLEGDLFGRLADMAVALARIQVEDARNADFDSFASQVSFSTIQERCRFPELMSALLARSRTALQGVPATMCHADFNLFNLFPDGAIDFQKSRVLLFGFDQLFCLINPYLFPPGGTERNRRYRFSLAQASELHARFEEVAARHRLPPLTQYQDCLSIWVLINFLLHNDVLPQFRAWRYRLLERLLRRYLNGEEVFWPLVAGVCDE